MNDCPEPDWYPDPPAALAFEWSEWRELAIAWMFTKQGEWNADDLRAVMPEGRPNWPGAAVNTASRRGLIHLTGRVTRSTHPSRKGSLLPMWQTNTNH